MFVKILRKKNSRILRETLYECGRVSVEANDKMVKLDLEGCPESMGRENIKVEIEKKDTTIYLMNDQGKTVDSIHFGEKNARPNHR